ncbi:hypothetical protein [Micromonospora polyrhachis]|uniref:Secreted protein n=1 Tax=Micromonospora polyrhachis TaxID=1282883 RepID=A0A7W7SWH2_9ACTN|nr:hypothetical protein [Micromonospora polyrhachis]MBB4962248.1 hypothetical protein [Micromonospora polyrhachis]
MRRRSTLTALTVIAVTAVTVAVPTAASAAPATLDPATFTLDQDFGLYDTALAKLDTALAGKKRSVSQVMAAANRTRSALCNQAAWQPLKDRSGADTIGFCWQAGDDDSPEWYPQGLTTTREAAADGHFDGHQLVASAWYHKGVGVTSPDGRCFRDPEVPLSSRLPIKGVRISLTDWDADFANTYRHLLLVEPYVDSAGQATYRPLLTGGGESLHAGGIAWYGQYLYVMDTSGGLRVFDFARIYSVATDSATAVGRQANGTYQAFNYAYVMPQVGRVGSKTGGLRFSFGSVDRGPASAEKALVVAEYAADAATAASKSRLVRFPFGADSRLRTGADGRTVTAVAAYNTGYPQMQGVAAYDGRYWFASSNGCRGGTIASHYGTLRHWNSKTGRTAAYPWAFGPEDLSYWHDPTTGVADYLWTQTEYLGNRVVVAVPQADWD